MTFINFKLDEETHRKFKSKVSIEGKKVKEVMLNLINEYINEGGLSMAKIQIDTTNRDQVISGFIMLTAIMEYNKNEYRSFLGEEQQPVVQQQLQQPVVVQQQEKPLIVDPSASDGDW